MMKNMQSNSIVRKIGWGIFIFFAVGVGLYPLLYFLVEMDGEGFLSGKEAVVLESSLWNIAFYGHIVFGGVSLLVGFSQFSATLRKRRLALHRTLGKVYLIAVLLSGSCAVYLAFYATGGLVSSLGFGVLAILWLFTTTNAYLTIRKKEVIEHENWMIRSYALTFAAVTLRLWIPILIGIIGLQFIEAYRIIAWMSWVPNLVVAEWWIRSR